MARMLTRSKSSRFLTGNSEEQEYEFYTPPLNAPQIDVDRKSSATLIPRAERRLETPDITIRPSTSDGPRDHTTMLHMNKTYLAPSDYSQDRVLAFPSPTKSTTVLYTAEVTEEQGIIGIALGSPTVGSHWNTTPQASSLKLNSQGRDTHMASVARSNSSSPSIAGRQEPPKSKLSRWRSLFRKAAPPPPPKDKPSFYQLVQTVTAASRADSHHDDDSLDTQGLSGQERGTGRKVELPAYRPEIRASRKAGADDFVAPQSPPVMRGRAATLQVAAFNPPATLIKRAVTTPNPPSTDHSGEYSAGPQVVLSDNTHDASGPASAGGLLGVSIPDVKMERYSIMFGNVLQSDTNRLSSLLVRRQGNADKLKPLNGLSVKEDQGKSPMDCKLERRATSPRIPSSSPRLSLFPSTKSDRISSPLSISANRARALQRSRTTPSKSPLQDTFSQGLGAQPKRAAAATLKPAASPHLTPAVTPTSIQSFKSDAESTIIVVDQTAPSHSQPWKVRLDEREPEWQMYPKPEPLAIAKRGIVTTASVAPPPPAKTSLARSDSQSQPKITKMSALSSHPSSAPLDAPSPLQRLQSLRSPPPSASRVGEKRTASETRGKERVVISKATVGVARSVSVSRANSPRALVRTMTDTGRIGSPNAERLVKRQVLTPTMVEVKNRKSQRVQLVDA